MVNGRLHFGTRLGSSPVLFKFSSQITCKHVSFIIYYQTEKDAEQFIQSNTEIDYFGFCKKWITEGYSPIFEWCSKDVPIILKYEKVNFQNSKSIKLFQDQLVLTALRNNKTGKYLLYEDMVFISK